VRNFGIYLFGLESVSFGIGIGMGGEITGEFSASRMMISIPRGLAASHSIWPNWPPPRSPIFRSIVSYEGGCSCKKKTEGCSICVVFDQGSEG